ncbi:disks large-associated protein 4-like [Oryx dammah]|uniref:disks large-associated protein 4-like n=1 Tax=Oryx dammah TaxID=59534 RepID=UPI001A9AA7E0|nr:disks large-associated protein 4-like [Oryx dammah]
MRLGATTSLDKALGRAMEDSGDKQVQYEPDAPWKLYSPGEPGKGAAAALPRAPSPRIRLAERVRASPRNPKRLRTARGEASVETQLRAAGQGRRRSVLGRVLSAVGSAQLLMPQKFQQFRGLCEQNWNPDANPRPTAQDLAGFGDLLQLSIKDISMKSDELYHLKANSWQLVETPEKRKEENKAPPPVPKKPAKSKLAMSRDKASDAGDKQRQEARKRLLAAKWAASVRQNSATESADSIEIYVPEAQTRL